MTVTPVRPPLPLTVVTGFLGAGKSTMLRRLLAQPHGLQIGLIINEMGQAGTEEPIAPDALGLELPEGCACCTRNPDLIAALAELHARGDLDRVIIETTGLADPLAISFTVQRPDVAVHARLDAIVTVVDPTSWRRAESQEWDEQVAAADLIVLSKLDLAEPGEVEALAARLHEAAPAARLLDGRDLPLAAVLDVEPAASRAPAHPHGRHSEWRTVALTLEAPVPSGALEDALEVLPGHVFRGKGMVAVEGGRWVAFHVVAGRLHFDPDVAAPQHRQSRLVFFGRDLDEADVRAILPGR